MLERIECRDVLRFAESAVAHLDTGASGLLQVL
jgi:hypothetical protein